MIDWNEEECIIDCGAYTGDTIKTLAKIAKREKFSWNVIAFEPDTYNYKCLISNLKRKKWLGKQVEAYNVGTWNENTVLYFKKGMGDSSRIDMEGTEKVKVAKIDDIVGSKKVSFIKMDVEGAELNSIKGAHEVIVRDHPKLAISIYHSDKDMLDIIEYLHEEFPFYALYVRHYTWLFADTVCYAINKNEKRENKSCL